MKRQFPSSQPMKQLCFGPAQWYRHARVVGALIVIASLSSGNVAASKERAIFRLDASPGPYSVGLKIVQQYDHSRTYGYPTDALGNGLAVPQQRPLQTLLWYPAKAGTAKRMTVGGYLALWADETTFGHAELSERADEWRAAMRESLDQPLRATRDAAPISGRFPIIIYSPGASDTAWENADLCEYLASFGYVVLATPSLGIHSRSMSLDLAGANTQASDIVFLLNYAQGLQNVDSKAVGVVGDSWGGLAGLFAAARDQRISAFVALDGSMRYFPGVLKLATDVRPERLSIPLLYFMQGDYSVELQQRFGDPILSEGPSVFDAWVHGDLIIAHLLGMAHASLCSMWQRNEDYWEDYGSYPVQPGDYDRFDAITGYAWMARYTLRFLEAYLKHSPAAYAFLKRSPTENGVPKHTLAVYFRSGTGISRTYEDLRAEVGKRGFANIQQIYADFRAEDPLFALEEATVEDWAVELFDGGHTSEAIAVLKLNTKVHPDSSGAQVELGDAYRLLGDDRAAIASYQDAIKANSENATAKRHLRDLSAHP